MTSPVKIHRRQKQTANVIGLRGRIVIWTIIRVAGKLFSNQTPYPVVIVELENNDRVMGQLVDWGGEDLRMGREVSAVLRRAYVEDTDGIINYIIKFRPL